MVLIFLTGMSSVADAQVTVATTKPINGARIEIAGVTPDGSYCRAPLGPETFFKLDRANHLFVVQPNLQRAAGLGKSDIAAYRVARTNALERLAANNKTLSASPHADSKFKAALVKYGAAPNPQIARTLLRAPSVPARDAKSQPDFMALERALTLARRDIAQARLSDTVLGMVSTCVLNVSRLPIIATLPSNGEARTLDQQSSDAYNVQAADRYSIVPLYELMENFGRPAPTEPPR